MTEYEFCCPDCGEDLTFTGDQDDASAFCPTCQDTVWVSPRELWQSDMDEQQIDYRRDDR